MVMLAKSYNEATDPTGMLASEKYDGVRSIFAKGVFLSRNGNRFFALAWFTAAMPKGVMLDGELFVHQKGGLPEYHEHCDKACAR